MDHQPPLSPFATALWTPTSRTSIDDRQRQIFHTWESYAAFLATVLLSALRQDADLAEVEGEAVECTRWKGPQCGTPSLPIRRVGGCDPRLSARFRKLLNADPDDRAALARCLVVRHRP